MADVAIRALVVAEETVIEQVDAHDVEALAGEPFTGATTVSALPAACATPGTAFTFSSSVLVEAGLGRGHGESALPAMVSTVERKAFITDAVDRRDADEGRHAHRHAADGERRLSGDSTRWRIDRRRMSQSTWRVTRRGQRLSTELGAWGVADDAAVAEADQPVADRRRPRSCVTITTVTPPRG